MPFCNISVDQQGIAVIEINNPPMNVISTEVLINLQDRVTEALKDDTVRVIIFTGAGNSFIAGADIKEIENCITKEEALKYMQVGQELMNVIENANKPSIAAINGIAVGGGLEFALACHMRVACSEAKIGFPEIKLGLIPGFGGTQRTPRLFGKALTYELILTGDLITAEEALVLGVINKVAPNGSILDVAKELAAKIAAKGRPAVSAALDVIRYGTRMDIMNAQALEREKFSILCETDNKKEGVSAFLEKRKPKPIDS